MTKELTSNKQLAQKLNRQAAGIVSKVGHMIEADTYCPEIIQQVAAVTGLLKSMEKELLVGHLRHCLEHRLHEDKAKTIQELLRIYDLSKRS